MCDLLSGKGEEIPKGVKETGEEGERRYVKESILTLHILVGCAFRGKKGEGRKRYPRKLRRLMGEEGELRSVKELSRQQISSGLGGSHSHCMVQRGVIYNECKN